MGGSSGGADSQDVLKYSPGGPTPNARAFSELPSFSSKYVYNVHFMALRAKRLPLPKAMPRGSLIQEPFLTGHREPR